MDITYPGPHTSVLVPALGRRVNRGETVAVDDGLGATLTAQGWKPRAKSSSGTSPEKRPRAPRKPRTKSRAATPTTTKEQS